MDQHRYTLGANGRQTDSAQLQANIVELHKTINRLQALQADYQKVIESAHENMREAKAIAGEVNTFILGVGPRGAD